jgi:acylaminoacyl-peptidase
MESVVEDTADAPLIPRKVFFENANALDPDLSADGQWLSWLAAVNGVMNVWAAPREDLTQARLLTRQTERPIFQKCFARTNAHILFSKDTNGDENFHLWCVALNGGEPRDLTPFGAVHTYLAGFHYGDPRLVAVAMNDRDARWHDLYIVNLYTGERRCLYENTNEVEGYILDSQLGLRLATTTRDKGQGLAILQWNGRTFKEIKSIAAEDVLLTDPLLVTRAGDAWYMASSIDRDKSAIVRIDWTTGEEKIVASHDRADIRGEMFDPATFELTAAVAEYVRREWVAIDPATGCDLARLERDLDGTIGVASQSEDGRFWIVTVNRPDQPHAWHLFDRQTGSIAKLFSSRPKLDAVPLAPMHGLVIKARDGLDLVSYLTLPVTEMGPRPSRPLPMVLHVHGGPWDRDGWYYSGLIQWYANRGYAVLQVNFRGSAGFGKAFVNAGDREWGGKMHDDLIDAVNWAVAEGIADPKRIAICGGSYGGYAAFVGATFTPEVFACSVPIVGITDLETMLANPPPYWASFTEQEYLRVGDPRTEEGRAFLKSRSPLHKAGNITKPILIGHGANDVRCKISESDQIVAAMKANDIPVTYVVFPDEGHGFAKPENSLAFKAITEAFLARHLGGRAEPVGDDFKGSSHEIRAGRDILRESGLG